ncbi:MAG: hypothetical protein LQ340_004718 [Diploschistes diacapsis]|nr:MAG: hypothetical protein LQ340_004718 [Diploschistes diacapsis]
MPSKRMEQRASHKWKPSARRAPRSDSTISTPSEPSVSSTTATVASARLSQTAEGTVSQSWEASSQTPNAPMNATSDAPQSSAESDADPLSDNANFLSFEEWKAQMLKRAGQSPEHVSGSGIVESKGDKRGRPPGINNALDSLGEEGELEIEFGGFVTSDATSSAIPAQAGEGEKKRTADESNEDKQRKQNKDAGTTSKERFNFASFDCAATVLKTNPGCKGATSILLENKDSYMLNTCSTDNKFLIVELCNDILIDTIVLGNFEFFSSTFRQFRVSVSDRYPVKSDKWKEIGTFEARNTRGVQAFLVENGIIWARYLRIEFLSYYGKEYYCPVSLLRVHGKTMMDDYRADVKASRGEEDGEDDEGEDEPAERVVAEPLKEPPSEAKQLETRETESIELAQSIPSTWQDTPLIDKCPRKTSSSPLIQQAELFGSTCGKSVQFCNMATVQTIKHSSMLDATDTKIPEVITPSAPTIQKGPTKTKATINENSSNSTKAKESANQNPPEDSNSRASTSSNSKGKGKDTATPTSNEASESSHKSSSKHLETTRSAKTQSEQVAVSATKIPSTPVPATQESFFKFVHKRLQQLEANSTLSLQYIEEQSRILREAFTKVEKRQLSKTSTFLETLNTTVLSELREFRTQYDQIWQSTVLELSYQREQSQKEVTALSQRLSILADEILWQKRIAYLQFGLILLCLGLLIFHRNQNTNFSSFDLQNMMAKPSSSFARYLSFDSPPGTPSRPGSRYGLFGGRFSNHLRGPSQDNMLSDDEAGSARAPDIEYQLPTPAESSVDGEETVEHRREGNGLLGSPEKEPLIRRALSTPNLGTDSDALLDAADADGERIEASEGGLEDSKSVG